MSARIMSELQSSLRELQTASQIRYASLAYMAGYLESTVLDLVRYAPDSVQRQLIAEIASTAERLQAEALRAEVDSIQTFYDSMSHKQA